MRIANCVHHLCADHFGGARGFGNRDIRREPGKDKGTIWRWQQRYREEGVEGLKRDKTRKPGTPPLSDEIKAKVLAKTVTETPPNAMHWSVRTMAKTMGISRTTAQRTWREAGSSRIS